jgi:hypothetical protein
MMGATLLSPRPLHNASSKAATFSATVANSNTREFVDAPIRQAVAAAAPASNIKKERASDGFFTVLTLFHQKIPTSQ